jgi:dephospho-CoA kinase
LKNKNKLIGVTGYSGTGKSTIANYLAEQIGNCIVLDIDKLVHKTLENKLLIEETVKLFGNKILNKKNKIDRKLLGEIFFIDEKKKNLQKQNTWKYVEKEIDKLILEYKGTIILDWFSLPKTKYFSLCNYKILVKSDDKIRKNRIMKRDNISLEYLELREKDQLQYCESDYDQIIFNDYKNLKSLLSKPSVNKNFFINNPS